MQYNSIGVNLIHQMYQAHLEREKNWPVIIVCRCRMCTRGQNLAITVFADGLAHNGVTPSTGTVVTVTLDISSFKFLCISMIQCHHH